MRGKFSATLVVVFSTLSIPAHAQTRSDWPADCSLERVVQVPMKLISGHVTIPASANGKDVTLVIDTAAPESSLTMEAFHRLGIVGLQTWRIGDLELDNLRPAIMAAFSGVDGLIAPAILEKYDVEFNFGDNKFSLFKHHPCANRAAYWTDAAMVIPFALTREGHIRVSVTLDGQKMRAILDTGAPMSVLSMQDASSMFGLTPGSADIKAADSVSGPWSKTYGDAYYSFPAITAYAYPFKTMTIGSVTVTNPQVKLIKGGYTVLGRNFLGPDYATLLIGNDVLSRFHLYIAYQEQKLYLTDAEAH